MFVLSIFTSWLLSRLATVCLTISSIALFIFSKSKSFRKLFSNSSLVFVSSSGLTSSRVASCLTSSKEGIGSTFKLKSSFFASVSLLKADSREFSLSWNLFKSSLTCDSSLLLANSSLKAANFWVRVSLAIIKPPNFSPFNYNKHSSLTQF